MIRAFADRQQARRVRSHSRKRGYIKLAFWSVLLIAAVIAARAGFSWMTGQGCFNLGRITVSGNRLVPDRDVLPIARYWLDKPIWRIDRVRLTAALQRRNPAIKQVDYALWPWWTLALTVRERQAVARIESDPALVTSAEGIVYRDSARLDLPVMRIAGTSGASRMRALTAIMLCPRPQAAWLFDPGDGSDIRLVAGGAMVHLGSGNFAAAWQKLGEIRDDLNQHPAAATAIDLRFRGQGIIMASPADTVSSRPIRN
jgi:hypothetical protein